VGLGLIVLGWMVQDSSYPSGLLLELGISLLLLIPFFLLSRWLEGHIREAEQRSEERAATLSAQVDDVREEVRRTSARLDELGEETRAQIRLSEQADKKLFHRFEDAPSYDSLVRLLARARELGAMSNKGVRVRIPGTYYWLRFYPSVTVEVSGKDENTQARSTAWVLVERRDGSQADDSPSFPWYEDESAQELMKKVTIQGPAARGRVVGSAARRW